MTLLSAAATVVSGIVAAAGWVAHHVHSLSVAPHSWTCLECGIGNELERDTCWSCGAGYGEDPLYPSHIPFDRRWLCPACAVWNGIARTGCWRCGAVHDGATVPGEAGGAREPLPASNAAAGGDASSTRGRPRIKGSGASNRRNS